MINKKILNPNYIIIGFIILNLLIGLAVVSDYGRSTDESNDRIRSELAFDLYTSSPAGDPAERYNDIGLMQYYGTGSSVIFRFIEHYLFPKLSQGSQVVAHYSYFIVYQCAVLGIFYLAKHFLDEWSSLAVALLFGTQPLLFGHAFINPKDIPLLTVFLLSVLTGFNMVENWVDAKSSHSDQSRRQIKFVAILLAFFFFFAFWRTLSDRLLDLVAYSYNTQGTSLPGQLFDLLTSSGSFEGYLILAGQFLWRAHLLAVIATPLILIFLFKWAGKHTLFSNRVKLTMLLAAAAWGLAISTRVVAIAAGGIVLVLAFVKYKQKAILPLFIYTISAFIFSYLTWPYLWASGYPGLVKSLTILGNFPWEGQVLFEGQIFSQAEIPARYLPKLMLLQFTEPLVIFSVAGSLIGLFWVAKKRADRPKMILLYAWFLLPIIFTTFLNSTNYSNFRQYFFISPPLFIFAGITIQFLTSKLENKRWVPAAFLVILLPSLLSIVRLHPYQYVYYNSFIGGVQEASGNYPLDYWNTAYKEAMDYVNQEVPEGSHILVWKNNLLGKAYAKGEYTFSAHTSVPVSEYADYDYAIIPLVWHADISDFKNYPVVYSVSVDSVELVQVRKITH